VKIYHGIDIVEIGKFRTVAGRHEGLLRDVFTDEEHRYCRAQADPLLHFAGRFAAKESCLKALGIGLSVTGIDAVLSEIGVRSGPSGKPSLAFSGWAAGIVQRKKIGDAVVTISHSGDYAVASVILVGL